jgi:hypothetical protein
VTSARLGGRALSTTTELEEHGFCSAPRATSATKIAPFGPRSLNLGDSVELRCQLRSSAGIIACHCGSAHPLIAALRDAELDGEGLQRAASLLDRLPTLVQRRVITTFGAITRPRRSL